MSDLKKYLDKQLADPAFAEEYEKQRPEYEAIRAMIAARLDSNMTQKELAEKNRYPAVQFEPNRKWNV